MLVASGAIATAVLGLGAAPASADYGRAEQYQIELSANIPSPQGGGVWLWIALNRDGTGDYAGSDCGHRGTGTASDKGDVTWTVSGNSLVITGVALNGLGGYRTTITAPAADGHYTGAVGAFLTLPPFIPPSAGNSQLEVAP